jgi:hypothetical protein
MSLKSVMAKVAGIEQEKIELASQKVELANINQLVQEVDNAEKLLQQYNDLYGQIDKLQPQLVKLGDSIVASQNKMNTLAGTFEKQFAELGLKFSDYPEFKRISNFMSRSREVGSMTAKIKQL